MEKTIYIAHKYNNLQENKDRVELIIKEFVTQYPTYNFLSPIHCVGYLYNDVSYEHGMDMCLDILRGCDECWVCSEDSKGVLLEKEYCKKKNIRIVDMQEVVI